jgi:hypothetical protein
MLAAGGEQADAELEACTLLHNNKNAPLIASLAGCRADDQGRLLLQTQVGCATASKSISAQQMLSDCQQQAGFQGSGKAVAVVP